MMDEAARMDLAQRLVDAAEYLSRQFFLGQVDVMDGLDMTVPQVKALMVLERNGPTSMSNISIVLGRTLSATTALVDRLVEKGMVTRGSDPNDRRLVICEITAEGTDSIARSWQIGKERIQSVLDMMTDQQLELAVIGMETMRDAEQQVQRSITELRAKLEPPTTRPR